MLPGMLLLALVWLALSSQWTPANFMLGGAIGALLLTLLPAAAGRTDPLDRVRRRLAFGAFVIGALVRSNLRVLAAIVNPRLGIRPAIVAVPLAARHSPGTLTVMANLISLTPGTLSLALSGDRRTLFVHAMDVEDVEAFRHAIRENFERPLLESTQ